MSGRQSQGSCASCTAIPATVGRTFPQMIAAYVAQLKAGEMPYLVADSVLYGEANLQKLAEVKWLTRVPERIALAQALMESVSAEEMEPAAQEGYRYTELCTACGGVRQHWPVGGLWPLVVWSAQAEKRERVALRKRVEKERQEAEKDWKALQRQKFPLREGAEEAVAAWAKRRAFHGVEARYPGGPLRTKRAPGPGGSSPERGLAGARGSSGTAGGHRCCREGVGQIYPGDGRTG